MCYNKDRAVSPARLVRGLIGAHTLPPAHVHFCCVPLASAATAVQRSHTAGCMQPSCCGRLPQTLVLCLPQTSCCGRLPQTLVLCLPQFLVLCLPQTLLLWPSPSDSRAVAVSLRFSCCGRLPQTLVLWPSPSDSGGLPSAAAISKHAQQHGHQLPLCAGDFPGSCTDCSASVHTLPLTVLFSALPCGGCSACTAPSVHTC